MSGTAPGRGMFVCPLGPHCDQEHTARVVRPQLTSLDPQSGSMYSQDLHARLQPLLIFFIDAANFIDDSAGGIDPRWELYTAVETTAAGQIIVSDAG